MRFEAWLQLIGSEDFHVRPSAPPPGDGKPSANGGVCLSLDLALGCDWQGP